MSLAILVGAPFALGTPVAAQEIGAPVSERFYFFPEMSFSFTPTSTTPGSYAALVSREGRAAPESTVPLSPLPSGAYGTIIRCSFVGPGTVRVVDTLAIEPKPIIAEEAIYCGLPESEADPSLALSFSTLAAPLATPSAPTIPGLVVGYVFELLHSRTSTTEVVRRDGTTLVGDHRDQRTVDTLAGNQLCRRRVSDITPIGGGTPSHTDTTSCTSQMPLRTLDFQILSFWGDSSITEERVNPAPGPTAFLRSIQRFQSTLTTTLSLTAHFPDLPEGATIREIRLASRNLAVYEPISVYQFDGVAPIVEPRSTGSLNCAREITSGDIRWVFPEPTLDPSDLFTTTQLAIAPLCPNVANGTTVTEGGNPLVRTTRVVNETRSLLQAGAAGFSADIALFPLTLLLTPTRDTVSPQRVPAATDTSSPVDVVVTGGEPGRDYQVRVSLEAFDALPGGHRHDAGVPPLDKHPTLDGAQETTCTVTTDSNVPPFGRCEVLFESSEVGGRANLAGEIVDEDATARTGIQVQVSELIDVAPLFARPGELARSPDADHLDADAFRLTSANAGRLERLAIDFEVATRDPAYMQKLCGSSAPAFPSGLYLSFNDMSLPRGGLFDILGNWQPPHASHRKGSGIDINGTVRRVADGAGVSVTRCLRRVISAKCADQNGFLVPEATIHCELR